MTPIAVVIVGSRCTGCSRAQDAECDPAAVMPVATTAMAAIVGMMAAETVPMSSIRIRSRNDSRDG